MYLITAPACTDCTALLEKESGTIPTEDTTAGAHIFLSLF